MHELSIAESVLQAVRAEVKQRPGSVPRKVGLRIGQMAAVDEDALRFAFEALTRDTELESLELGIEICPLRCRCPQCGNEFVVQNYESQCVRCGNTETQCVGGDELDLAYVEVEENEPSAAAAKSS